MRVIAGKYKSRVLKAPKSSLTRPTTDKNKENMFNILNPYLSSGNVLDLFGGSGGLGIEALSRGYNYLYSCDKQYEAFKTIKENIKTLGINDALVLKMDYKKALSKLKENQIKIDLVFLDPPYGKGMVDGIMDTLDHDSLLNNEAIIVIEELIETKFDLSNSYQLLKRKEYGITALNIYRYEV
ncbi:MAG: 16S rRNA (guanine(966)-N(2))-methyltransferase RsmD [Thomasclavelia sp.]|jgi:16S rRNA (guanine966-N2)-methyltransferase|nr:16S rRNA (guanine(966)-N(2))-methyltransferase RsmD [Thomasclavelia sp.]